MVDRSHDFQLLLQEAQRRLGSAPQTQQNLDAVPQDRHAFNEATSEVARGIHDTSIRLKTLTQLVREQGLFNDKTSQINPLIARINSEVADLNQRLDMAQMYVDTKKRELGEKNQSADHSVKVVKHLKSELMVATKGFKEVLEMRSEKMKDQQQRRALLTGPRSLAPAPFTSGESLYPAPKANGSSVMVNPYARMNGQTSAVMQDSQPSTSTQGSQLQQQQQQLIATPQINYYQEREQAITEVERTINQLGEMFKRLSTVIAQQAELVERIDDDVEAANENVTRGHQALLDAFRNASTNRALYMKLLAVAGVFSVFFMLFVL